MPRLRRHPAVAVAAAFLLTLYPAPATSGATGAGPSVTVSGSDWPQFLMGPDHASYAADAAALTPANVPHLKPIFRWVPPRSTNGGTNALLATPTTVAGVVYVGAKDGEFYAYSLRTQQLLWSRFLGVYCGSQGIESTATVTTDPGTGLLMVYVNAPDGHVDALDAATGDIVWQASLDNPSTTRCDYYSWGSPLVADGMVYVGISSDFDSPLVPGGVTAFDQETGATVATWSSLPAGQVGGSVWSTPALAPDGSIIVTTGNGYSSTGQLLYDESIVKLAPLTLAVEDYWQVPPSEQATDGDFGGSPTIFSADLNGVPTPMVGACNKNGLYYAWREGDLSAGPVWEHRMTVPYPGKAQECVASAVWNGSELIEGGGAPSDPSEPAYSGSIAALDPATGASIWETHLDGTILGSPSEDGGGVVTAPTYQSDDGNLGVYLLDAGTGTVLAMLPTPHSPLFGQAVFAGDDLVVGAGNGSGLTDYQVTTPGPAVSAVSPASVPVGTSTTVTLTGSGFSGTPTVFLSGFGSTASKVSVLSSTTLTFKLTVGKNAPLGPEGVSVIEPGYPPVAEGCDGCITVAPPPTPPSVTGLDPPSLDQGAHTAPATLSGAGFEAGVTVRSSPGITVKSTFVNAAELSLAITVGPTTPPGAHNLVVTNPDGGAATCTGCLQVVSPPDPAVVSVVPGVVGQQGTYPALTIYGNGFDPSSTVTFSPATLTVAAVTYVSPMILKLSVHVPPTAPTGPLDVAVSTPAGDAACAGCLTIDPQPVVASLGGAAISGATVVITATGHGFEPGLSLKTSVPGATLTGPSVPGPTSFDFSVTVPAGTAPGAYKLSLRNPDGGVSVYKSLQVTAGPS